jgi:hypothetical protein
MILTTQPNPPFALPSSYQRESSNQPMRNCSPDKLRGALQERATGRYRFLLRLHLRQVDALADLIP